MVDLPPAITDLNEYARFAFLNEMHALALGITSDDSTVCANLGIAIQTIDAERNSMKPLFTGPYDRPPSGQCVALLLRCAELYLKYGTWFELSHAESRLIEGGYEQLVATIRPIFAQTQETDKCSIESPIIELTITRLELMRFFHDKQRDLYSGLPAIQPDPYANIAIDSHPVTMREKYANYSAPNELTEISDYISTDREYLEAREMSAWEAFRSFCVLGSVFVFIWYIVFLTFSVLLLFAMNRLYPVTPCFAIGYSFGTLVSELLSCRVCSAVCSCRPNICLYFVQYVASWVAGIAMIVWMILEDVYKDSVAFTVLAIQHIVSVILPLFCQPCFFVWHRRIERQFKWIRIRFFHSLWWIVVQIFFCLLFTPGILGIQSILAIGLKNRPTIAPPLPAEIDVPIA
jgi:hypothetical protein